MHIGKDNIAIGNDAMASVLLLYYHIVSVGGFCHAETVYIEPKRFNGFDFLEATVEESYQPEVCQTLIRQGAVIYLICDLNDSFSEYDDWDYQKITKEIIDTAKAGRLNAIPETSELINLICVSEAEFNLDAYKNCLQHIYEKYVLATFINLIEESKNPLSL